MTILQPEDFTGYSDSCIDEAVQNALEKAGEYVRVKVIETRGRQANGDNRQYQVTVTTYDE